MSKKQFKAESQRLLDLMIHSIYTHKEIFLRELISNASDAVDKLCYQALTSPDIGLSRSDFAIDISIDKEARTLTISDNGIGMTREEMENNLGTIAKSGSLDFKQTMAQPEKEEDRIDIIGQFGVGFYSAFMVSDKVTVESRAHGSAQGWRWESTGSDGYTIEECAKDTTGTDIIMHMKAKDGDEDYDRFLEEYTLAGLVKKYSDYIRYPIRMDRERRRPVEGGDEGETETYTENETLNSMIPIWQRTKSQVKTEDLNDWYKEHFYDYTDPIKAIHVEAEGAVTYKALLFIPAKVSYDYYTKEYEKGLQLYSNGVLIMDKCADLVPEHFRFVRGVVDSPDLSLNISRELLQHDRQLKVIAANIEKKIRSELLALLKNNRNEYEKFHEQFGLQLKYGVVSEFGRHQETLRDLLLFASSHEGKMTSLQEYLDRMGEEQKDIYYATGESPAFIDTLPQAEVLRDKGYEILYFTHEVDEFVAQTLVQFGEKSFKSVNRDELGLETEEERETIKQQEEESRSVLDFVKETLGDAVKEVRLSHKLKSQPVCLTAAGSVSFEMEKYLKQMQPGTAPKAQRVLELNAEHPVFAKLKVLMESDKDKAAQYTEILHQQAKLMAGLSIDDPAAYSKLIFGLM